MGPQDLVKFQWVRTQLQIVHKGQMLFRAGTPLDALYVVRSGTIKARLTGSDGGEQISGFYLPGEVVGLDGIENRQYASTAEALETCSVCVFPFAALMGMARTLDGLQSQLWHHASHEIAVRQRLLMTIGRRGAEGRVAEFLLSVSGRFERFGYSGTRFRLPMSRQDIADYVGLSVETVCRVLTRFQDAGIIQRDQREITINRADELSKLSAGASECPPKYDLDPARPGAPPRSPADERHLQALAAG